MISNEKEFWSVGYSQWGRWQVRKAPVDQPDKYTLVEDLGPELKAAYLEADGDFVYLAGQEHISLITSGTPWLFVITTDGKLYVKKVAEPLDTALLLDTEVEEACACRGWKSDKYSVDDGLIIAYRKQVGAFIRVYHQIQSTYLWDDVQIISSRKINHIGIKRLNDFRIGILLDDEMLITDRSYIGGTAKSEYVYLDLIDDFRVWSFTNTTGPNSDFKIEEVLLKDNIEFWVRGNYPFYAYDSDWPDVIINTNVVPGQEIERFWVEDGYLKIRMKLALTSSYSYMSFRIPQVNRIQFERTAQSRPVCPQLDIVYQAPPVPVLENVALTLDTVDATIRMLEVRNLKTTSQDEITFDVSMTNADIRTVEVNTIRHTSTDEIAYGLTVTGSSIVTVMSGIKPI